MESTTSVPLVVKKVNVQDYFALKMKNVKVSGIASSGLSKFHLEPILSLSHKIRSNAYLIPLCTHRNRHRV
jgi:hypothetical protein